MDTVSRQMAKFPTPQTGSVPQMGVVGLGYWGPNLIRAVSEISDARVSAICDLDRARLVQFADRYPSARPTERFEDLLEDPSLDAIMIATPITTHYELTMRALRAGKHVFVEKPLATSGVHADAIVEAAGERGLVLMCGHTFVHSPPVNAIRELLDRDELGELFYVSSSRVNLGPYRSDVSVLTDLAPHDFSILRHWIPEIPESVSATGRAAIRDDAPDVAFVTLRYASGLVAQLEVSWLAPSKLRRTVLVGSKKMIVYEDGTPEPVRIFDRGIVFKDPETFGEFQLSYRTGDIVSPRLEPDEPLLLQLGDFVHRVRVGRSSADHLALCADVVRLLEASEESLQAGGHPVSVAAAPRTRVDVPA